jgi:hypothetical protein
MPLSINPRCCPPIGVDCGNCLEGTTPKFLWVTVSGIENDWCSGCTAVNATWQCVQQLPYEGCCRWSYSGEYPCPESNGGFLTLGISVGLCPDLSNPGTWILGVLVDTTEYTIFFQRTGFLADPADCFEALNGSVSWIAADGPIPTCDGSGAGCTVSTEP